MIYHGCPIFHHIDVDLPRIYVKCVLLPLIAVDGLRFDANNSLALFCKHWILAPELKLGGQPRPAASPSSIFKTYGKTNTPNNNPTNINLCRMV